VRVEVVVNELAKETREVIAMFNGLRERVAGFDVPEENEHLQSYALDGLFSAIGYLETLASRAEGNED
jgi:hypothetical protein